MEDIIVKVFLSYSSKDESLAKSLKSHLKLHENNKLIEIWDYSKIDPGDIWDVEIEKTIESSDLILFLLSSNFINSDYSYEKEVQKALSKKELNKIEIIPIILSHIIFEETSLAAFQALPKGKKPINSWEDINEPLNQISIAVRDKAQKIKEKKIKVIAERLGKQNAKKRVIEYHKKNDYEKASEVIKEYILEKPTTSSSILKALPAITNRWVVNFVYKLYILFSHNKSIFIICYLLIFSGIVYFSLNLSQLLMMASPVIVSIFIILFSHNWVHPKLSSKKYFEELKNVKDNLIKIIAKLRGEMRRLQESIISDEQKIKFNLNLASKAYSQNKTEIMILKSREAGRIKELNMKLRGKYEKLRDVYEIYERLYKKYDILYEDIKSQIEVKEEEKEFKWDESYSISFRDSIFLNQFSKKLNRIEKSKHFDGLESIKALIVKDSLLALEEK